MFSSLLKHVAAQLVYEIYKFQLVANVEENAKQKFVEL